MQVFSAKFKVPSRNRTIDQNEDPVKPGSQGEIPPPLNWSAGMNRLSYHHARWFFLCFIHDVAVIVRCGVLLAWRQKATTWARGPVNLRSGFMRPSSRGSRDEVNECCARSHVVRGQTEADNLSVSDSVRPELGHNEFGLKLLSPHYPWAKWQRVSTKLFLWLWQQQKLQKYGYLRGRPSRTESYLYINNIR